MATKRTREDDVKRKKYIRKRFRNFVNFVAVNMQWLEDKADTAGISMNVKRNVAILVRQKQKVGMMTLADKTLLRTRPEARSIADRKKLCTLVANLPCFRIFPPKMRAHMIPHLLYMQVNTGQVILREGDVPAIMYFVLSGQIEMNILKRNTITGKHETIPQAIFGAGDFIGDMEVIEDHRRMSNCVAITTCELLYLFEPQYRNLLVPFLKTMWNQKKAAIRSLSYFDFLNPTQILHACKFSSLANFEPLDTIYQGDEGSAGYTHFILSGECMVLQCLSTVASYQNGEKVLNLLQLEKGDMVYAARETKAQMESDASQIYKILFSSSQEDRHERKTLEKVEFQCGQYMKNWAHLKKPAEDDKFRKEFTKHISYNEEEGFLDPYDEQSSSDSDESVELEPNVSRLKKSNTSLNFSKNSLQDSTETCSTFTSSTYTSSSSSTAPPKPPPQPPKPPEKDVHFINVASLTFGGVFGIGEDMRDRTVMAKTVVQCLILPRYWLLQEAQNPVNIWGRRKSLFETVVPSREKIFQIFLCTRKWDVFRHRYVKSCLDTKQSTQFAKKQDIPIMCTIIETNDK